MTAKTDKFDTGLLFPCICDGAGVWGESVKIGQTEIDTIADQVTAAVRK